MPYLLKDFNTRMFADDTTLSLSDTYYEPLISNFNLSILSLIDWCKYNKTDINWSKTEIMFISNKRNPLDNKKLKFPSTINILGNEVRVVNSFKLLGITIDDTLNFHHYASELKKSVYRKLYSIKRLFYLSFSVKLQFFKTFIQPYFDYCSTIFIYFSRSAIQRIANYFYICLNKLLNFNFSTISSDFNIVNNSLEKVGLNSFQHRLFIRLMTFSHKLFNSEFAPQSLKNCLQMKSNIASISTRSSMVKSIAIYDIGVFNDYGKKTFNYFFGNFINVFCINDFVLSFKFFKTRTINNVNLFFKSFISNCSCFDIKYMVH